MDCDCSIDGAGDENEFYYDEWRVARKPHTCCECQRTIQPKERYECVTLKCEGELSTFKTCLGCYRIRKQFMPWGWCFGTLAEDVAECIGFNFVTGAENPHYEAQEGVVF